MRQVLLLACLLGAALSCSCAPIKYRSVVCESDIYRVKIVELIVDEKNSDFKTRAVDDVEVDDEEPTIPTSTTFPSEPEAEWYEEPTDSFDEWINGQTTVRAEVVKAYRGGLKEGDSLILTSHNMDSLCGVGNMLSNFDTGDLPNHDFVVATNNLETAEGKVHVSLCSIFRSVTDQSFENIESVLMHHDCTCQIKDCRLREGKKVFRGNCNDHLAYCARDKKNTCRWNGVMSVNNCLYK